MNCLHISKENTEEVVQKGIINFSQSDGSAKPCPFLHCKGRRMEEKIKSDLSQCESKTSVTVCYDLEHDVTFNCSEDIRPK